MAVKFPLKMPDGTAAGTIEKLREHFDLEAVLGYYSDGRLERWLLNGYYDDEAEKVKVLKTSGENANVGKSLCEILGVAYSEDIAKSPDIDVISRRNKRKAELKQYTADEDILSSIDSVAFTQEELQGLLEKGTKEIYLCGDNFAILPYFEGIIYKGVNRPMVTLQGESCPAGIVLQNVNLDPASFKGDDSFENYFAKNPQLGVRLLREKAEQGDAVAQFKLGLKYVASDGIVGHDPEEAVKWLGRSSGQGYAKASVMLGMFYATGVGLRQDIGEAKKWYRRALEQGDEGAQKLLDGLSGQDENDYGSGEDSDGIDIDIEKVRWDAEMGSEGAQCVLGMLYLLGKGVEQNGVEAVKWLRESAGQGFASAQSNLGRCYENGWGVAQDTEEAIKWYRKAAAQGDEDAQEALDKLLYEENINSYDSGETSDVDFDMEELLPDAEQGDVFSQVLLGDCYSSGEGLKQDYVKAVMWYRKAAEQGDAEAQYKLGECYANGQGVAQDKQEAMKWYRKAAEQGDDIAQYKLGECYANGQGVAQDKQEAMKWYRKAAEQGDDIAQYKLGECYANGQGVAQDKQEAIKWYRKAAEQGFYLAKIKCDRIT